MTFLKACKDEFGLYKFDKWLLVSVSLVPLLLFIIASNIFGNGVVRDLPIGVVDMDNSTVSRDLIRYFNSSSTLHVSKSYLNEKDATKDLRDAKIYAYLAIPPNFQTNITKGFDGQLGMYYNTQFILIGRSVKSAFEQVVGNFNAKLSIGKNLSKGDIKLSQAYGQSVVFNQQITPLYNIGFSYSLFLLSIILPCIWQIILISSMVLNLAAQDRKTTIKSWIKTYSLKGLLAKLFVHQIFMFIWCLGFIWYFFIYLNWEMNGSYTYIFFMGFLTILASEAIGFFMYFATYDASRALSMAAAFTAPSLAFVGVTFPVSDMSQFAKIWHKLLPISHYINVQISQANYGASILNTISDIYWLLGFNLAFLMALFSVRMIYGKQL